MKDELPRWICKNCVNCLEYSYKFKIQCEYTDRKLRDAIELATQKQSDKETQDTNENVDDVEKFCIEEIVSNEEQFKQEVVEDAVLFEQNEELQLDEENHENIEYAEELELTEENDELQMIEYLENVDEVVEADEDIVEMEDEIILEEEQEEADEEEYLSKGETENEEDNFHFVVEEQDEYSEGDDIKEGILKKEKPFFNLSKTYKCETCSEEFHNYNDFNTHKKTHGNQRFQCDICQRWFSKRYHLKNHQIIHNGTKNYDCQLCTKKYTNHGNLDRHVRVFHNKERAYVCDICGKGFSQSTILRQHYTVHVDERNFECEICHKTYKTLDYLNLHKETHLPKEQRKVKTYVKKKYKKQVKLCVCTFCGKKSNSLALHQSHMRTHTGEKPYECPTCQKRFSFQQSLRTHLLLHTGAKPFKCETCGLTFRQIGHLKGHKLVHSGEKNFKCMACEKTFALRGNLTVHMRLHTGETPYHCTQCPKKFYDSNGLKRHKLVHSKNQSTEVLPIQYVNEENIGEIKYQSYQTNDIVTQFEYDPEANYNLINIATNSGPINFVKKIKDEKN